MPRASRSGSAKFARASARVLIGALWVLCLSPAGFAQTTSGLTGTLTSLSSASMPGATITLTGTETTAA